jgi:cell wall-associated NlpC family hydrolase
MYRAFMARPGYGFDCSGLTSWAWARAGVRLPHQSRLQYYATDRVPISEAQPGDLLFFYSPISHVGMYVGDGLMIDASRPGKPISVHGFKWSSVVGVGRPR